MKRSNNIIIRALAAVICAVIAFTGMPAPAAAEGDTVILGYLAAYNAKLNPFLCTERDLVSVGSLIYESLFELDQNQQPQPLLAETWSRSESEGVWTINMRSGVLFHNGVELVAQDVVESWNYFRNADEANPYYGRVRKIDSITATDTFQLQVECDYPGYLTLYCLTFPIVQRDTAYADVPMGTGPYWCTSYVQDTEIRLEANPLWWKQQPTMKVLQFNHYWDISDMLSALQAGDVEMFQTRSATAALTKKLDYASFLDYSTTSYEVLIPNMNGILGDPNLRKAIMYAIDYDTLTSNVYLNMAQQCEVPISPSSWLYETQSAVYYYSPERAMQYLYDSGWTDMTGDTLLNKVEDNVLKYIDVNIIVYNEASTKVRSNAAEQIAANLRAVGINATVEVLSRRDVRKAMENGAFDIALVSMNLSEVPDLIPLFSAGGDLNYSGVSNETLTQMLKECAYAENEAAMKMTYSNIQTYIVENLPVMGLCFRTGMVLSGRSMAGMTVARETDAFSGIEFLVE